ncbi:MucR family transcriptional regulator [Mailhella sp.]|uniref:MucR family transcriptional regulator n=1 Tax=Mailhella sp. TaxID=1981029 RepID=UPI003AB351FD
MDDYLKQAIELVKAQSSVRVMQEEEMVAMIRTLASSLKELESGVAPEEEEDAPQIEPSKSIKEKSITCLECGKSFKLITKKHLARHGLDADSYRRKWGLKSDAPLVCKSIQRVRRKKMKDMRLWEKRHAAAENAE